MQQTFAVEATPYMLRLYVAGQTPKCMRAFSNLKRICEQYGDLSNTQRVLAGLDLGIDVA